MMEILAEILKWAANISILYTGLVLGIFVFIYGMRRWRKYPGGRAVMYFVVSLELLILLAVIGNWIPQWQGISKEILRDFVYGFIAFTSTRMVWTLFFRWQEVVDAVTASGSVEKTANQYGDRKPHRDHENHLPPQH